MVKGGVRKGAGRPKGKGPFGEATKPVRLPVSLVGEVMKFVAHRGYKIPLYSSKVQAGFPSPSDDHMEGRLDLNEELVKNPAATFLVRATGDSMINVGIKENDLLVVDRSLEATSGKIVVAALDGQLTVKRLQYKNGKIYLMAENDNYPPIEVYDGSNFYVWGVVTRIIHTPYM
jgi:DNA polymerase V